VSDISVFETNRFAKSLEKLPPVYQEIVENEIDKIIAEPLIGNQKKGDLSHLWVHKFKIKNQQWLLGYNWNNEKLIIHLLQLGSHENYYQEASKKRNADFKLMK